MERERWEQVEQIFHDALRVEESSRGELVRRRCPGDEDLRREVESLLAHHDETGSFIETPAFAGAGASDSEAKNLLAVGTQLGPYRIEAHIGAGGMGQVYRARARTTAIRVRLTRFRAAPLGQQEHSGMLTEAVRH